VHIQAGAREWRPNCQATGYETSSANHPRAALWVLASQRKPSIHDLGPDLRSVSRLWKAVCVRSRWLSAQCTGPNPMTCWSRQRSPDRNRHFSNTLNWLSSLKNALTRAPEVDTWKSVCNGCFKSCDSACVITAETDFCVRSMFLSRTISRGERSCDGTRHGIGPYQDTFNRLQT